MAFSFTDYAAMKPGEDRYNPLTAILQGMQQRNQLAQQKATLQQSLLANQKQQAQSKFWGNPLYQGDDTSKMIGAFMDAGLIKPEQLGMSPQNNHGQVGQQPGQPGQQPGQPSGLIQGILQWVQSRQQQSQPQQQPQQQPGQPGQQEQPQSNQQAGAFSGNPLNGDFKLNTGNPLVDSLVNSKFADKNYKTTLTRNWAWDHTPEEGKTWQLGVAASLGIDPGKFISGINQGKDLQQQAKEAGFDPNNLPDPSYLATKADINKLHTRQAALKEADTIGDFVKTSLAPYARTFSGYSPAQIKDAVLNLNPDKQADYLAAAALAPELGYIRLQLAQGRAGKGALDEIMQRSLLNTKNIGFTVSPEVFSKMQDRMNEILKKSFGRAESIYNAVKKNPSNKSSNENDPLGLL